MDLIVQVVGWLMLERCCLHKHTWTIKCIAARTAAAAATVRPRLDSEFYPIFLFISTFGMCAQVMLFECSEVPHLVDGSDT